MGGEARKAMEEWPWGRGKWELFERGAVGWGQELMGMHSTRSYSLCLAGRGRQRDLVARSCPDLQLS